MKNSNTKNEKKDPLVIILGLITIGFGCFLGTWAFSDDIGVILFGVFAFLPVIAIGMVFLSYGLKEDFNGYGEY